MYRKFSSFEELVSDMSTRDGVAIRYAGEDDIVRDISYSGFAEMIREETLRVKAECSGVEVVIAEQTPDSIISIFSHVISGCDIIVSDPMLPE